VRKEELRDLARRLSSGPSDPTLYERLLDAAAVTRCGLELLQQLAEELDGREPPLRAVHDPAQRAAFRPGERLLDPDGEEARSDLLDQAAGQLRLSLGAGSAGDLQELLGTMTAAGLASQLEGTLADFLDALPEEALAGLRRTARRSTSEEGRSALERVAAAMLPHPAGEDGDLLLFAGDRLRDALSLLRTGREMLHEIRALLPPLQGEAVEPAAFVPGRPVRLLGLAVPTDPLELLHAELSALLASTPDAFAEVETWLASLLGSLDRQGRPVGALASYLTGEVLTDLAAALGLPAEVPRESPRLSRRVRASGSDENRRGAHSDSAERLSGCRRRASTRARHGNTPACYRPGPLDRPPEPRPLPFHLRLFRRGKAPPPGDRETWSCAPTVRDRHLACRLDSVTGAVIRGQGGSARNAGNRAAPLRRARLPLRRCAGEPRVGSLARR
jgi:hypothetical protein